ILAGVTEAATREAVKACGDRDRGLIPGEASVCIQMSMSVLVTSKLQRSWQSFTPTTLGYMTDPFEVDSAQPTFAVVIWDSGMRCPINWRARKVTDRCPNGTGTGLKAAWPPEIDAILQSKNDGSPSDLCHAVVERVQNAHLDAIPRWPHSSLNFIDQ